MVFKTAGAGIFFQLEATCFLYEHVRLLCFNDRNWYKKSYFCAVTQNVSCSSHL